MDIANIIENNKKSILLVDLQKTGPNGQKMINIRGTGFLVSPDGKFVTNAHVYNLIPKEDLDYMGAAVPGTTNEKKLTQYVRYPIKLLYIDTENDLALMQIIAEKKFDAVTLGNSDEVSEGNDVVFIGYPLAVELLNMNFGITMNTNKCIISSIKRRGVDGSLHFFMVDTHINNGSSGSPVFSMGGEVIGVASGKISTKIPLPNGSLIDIPANMGICRPIKYAIELINKNK